MSVLKTALCVTRSATTHSEALSVPVNLATCSQTTFVKVSQSNNNRHTGLDPSLDQLCQHLHQLFAPTVSAFAPIVSAFAPIVPSLLQT